eukprot:SAG31_NODE_14702_length_791_cov_1.739884_1_plen_49_part_10
MGSAVPGRHSLGAWGVSVVICAILNCLLGLLASLVGLKHIMLKKAATPA